ncbi:MAG: Yellowstone Lake virophage 6 [Pseudomonadota bacterium]|jgi:hypothetical protein
MSNDLQPDNFSKETFSDILRASYMNQRDAANYMAKKYNYGYDPLLSSMEQKVFVSPTGKPIIAERGSVRLTDWLYEDPRLATFGGQFFDTRRVSEAKNLSKAVQEKYGMAPTITGHSLGGYLSEQAAKATPESQVYTYNKASGFPSIFGSTPKNQYDYRTTLDVPSALSQFQSGNRTTVPGSWNPFESHAIKYLK